MALAYVTVTGTWDDGSGQAVTGTVTFTPSATVYSSGQQVVTPAAPVQCPVVNGRLTTASGAPVQLLATDNTGLTLLGHTGFWFWTASVNIGGGSAGKTDEFSFFLPTGPPVDLYSLANQVLSDFPNPLTALGDLMAGGAGGSPVRLAGNASSAREFLISQGTGTAAQAPAWGALQAGDIPALPYAPVASPALTGSPTAPTQAPGDNSTKIATDAFVTTAVATETTRAQAAEALLAPKASPAFTGTVTVPVTVNPTDAAQKAYVDSVAQGLDNKQSVTALASSNITLSGTQTIDGVAVTAGQRVLATGQSTASQNGLWVVAAGAWARPADFAGGSTQLGASVFVEAGTVNGSSGWVLTGATAVTVDTSPQTWTQFSGAGEVTAGTGLTKTGNTIGVTPGTYDAAGAAAAAQAASTPVLTRAAVQTSNFTASANQVVPVDTTSGSVTVTLPSAPAAGTVVAVKQVTLGTGHSVTIACAGSDVFNKSGGAGTGTLSLLAQGMLLHYASGIWTVLADDLPLSQLDARYLGAGATVVVPKPTGATATDTPAVTAAITALATALASGPATLLFQDGTYQVDSNSAVIRNVSNFAVRSAGRTVITQAPNRSGLVNNVTGDLLVIADCTDFTVSDITLDGMRDTVAPLTPLTASAASGQPSVTVAAGQGSRYLPGQNLALFGGLGSSDQALSDGFNTGITATLVVSSVTPGGGSGGGDLITFTANLAHTYTQVGSTLLSDSYGPYACAGAYLTPYQCGYNNSAAGRTGLYGEDQQNGLHLMNCQRFTVRNVTARNVWESPVKIGCGIGPQGAVYANSCYSGLVTGCALYHGYDQGVSVWISQDITVRDCYIDSPGWGGVVLTESDYCTVGGNQVRNVIYFAPGQAGAGIAVEGGISNVISGNAVTSPLYSTVAGGIAVQGWPTNGTWGLGTTNTNWPTLGAYLQQGTVAGTSVLVSSTTRLAAGGRYSVVDGYRTESLTVSTVVDSTHVTFSETTRFSHASGLYISPRISQENTVSGNTVDLAGAGASASGIFLRGSVRSVITGNTLRNWTNNGIDLNASSQFCPPSTFLGGDGSQVSGNVLGGGSNFPLPASGVSHVSIAGNTVFGTPQSGSNRGISLAGVTDSVVSGNTVSDVNGSDAIRIAVGGPSSLPCARLTVTGNVTERSNGSGLSVTAADSCTITGNTAKSHTAYGISASGVTNSLIGNNVCNSNQSGGIILQNNSGTGCSNCRVTGNTCRDDGSGVNVTSGATWTQPHGIQEAGNSNVNLFTGNECDANGTDQLTTAGAATRAFANILSGVLTSPPVLALDYGGLFGDGSDGSAALDGTAAVAWASKASSVYTLTRDCFLTSLTVNNGVTLNTSGYRVFCAGTVTNNGTIAANGNAAGGTNNGTGGASTTSGSLQGGASGANGATGAGSSGAQANSMFGTGSGNGGGTGSGGAGGGSRGQNTSVWPHRDPALVLSGCTAWQGGAKPVSGAPGGGSGGGDGTNVGGGGGSGAGIVAILAWSVVNSGTISAAGGNGGTPTTGNCGGGGGGGGGLILIYTLSAWTAGTTSVAGGTQGSGVGTGTAGTAGTAGTVLNVVVQ